MSFTTQRLVRLSDLDQYARVHNLSLIQYIEDAEVEMALALCTELVRNPVVGWAAAHREATFIAPLPMSSTPVNLQVNVHHIGRATLTLHTVITGENGIHASGTGRHFAVDPDGRRRRLGDEEQGWWRSHLAAVAR
ncbi:acyl-CoA thioesterase [Streptomyces sp. NPDC002740]